MSEPAVAASAGAFERLGARGRRWTAELGGASCAQLIAGSLARLSPRDVGLEAWQALLPADAALALARDCDEALACGAHTGPLHGLAVGIKDVIDTADLPTEYGSPIYRGHRPERDARCVRLLREAGAIVIGKTVTCEFANYPPSDPQSSTIRAARPVAHRAARRPRWPTVTWPSPSARRPPARSFVPPLSTA